MRAFALFASLTLLIAGNAWADSFTNLLNQAGSAEKQGDVAKAAAIYDEAAKEQKEDATNLCILSRRYCDLTFLTQSQSLQKDLLTHALGCALQAEAVDPSNATAHASVAVCYAKSCAFADIKTQLEYSRLFKEEAEKTIALDPKQDVAWYLLGRWNYAIAGLGFFSRAYVKVIYGGLPKASYEDAVRCFKKACDIAPNRILNHAGLAMAYGALGEKKLQRAELERCSGLKPSDIQDAQAQREAKRTLEELNR